MRTATEDDIAEIRRVAQLIEDSDEPSEYAQLNWRFHESLYRPARRDYALDIVRKIHDKLDRYVRLRFTLATHKEQVIRERAEILKLYATKKPVAKYMVRQHIMNAAEQFAERLANKGRVAT